MNSFDDIIQQKADGHKAPVPPGAWDNIIKKEKKRRYLFFWWMLAILLCGSTIGGYYIYQGGKNAEETQVAKVDVVNKIPEGDKIEDKIKTADGITDSNVDKVDTDNLANKDEFKIADNEKGKLNTTIDGINEDKVEVVKTENKKERPKTVYANKNTNKTVINSKNKRKPPINEYDNSVAVNDNIENKNTDSWIGKNKSAKKGKARTAVKIIAPGTTDLTAANEANENLTPATKNEPSKNDELKNDIAKENKNPVDPPIIKKEAEQDSTIKKTSTTKEEENKKSVPVAKKQKIKNPSFIDIAASPVFPFQQYDRSTTFNRTLFNNNSQTVFTGKLVSTDIDPSLAFSVGLRKQISKRFYFGLGFQYVELKEKIHISGTETKTNYNIIDVLDNSGGTPQLIRDTFVTVTQGKRDINAVNSYHFFDIPVFLQYSLVQKRSWSLNAVAGVQVNIAARYKNELNRDSIAPLISSAASSAKTAIGLSVYGGLRFAKPIGKKFEFFCLPFVDLNLGKQNIKNSLINKKIQQAGLSLGLSYKLN